jgi:hypothetical protein
MSQNQIKIMDRWRCGHTKNTKSRQPPDNRRTTDNPDNLVLSTSLSAGNFNHNILINLLLLEFRKAIRQSEGRELVKGGG